MIRPPKAENGPMVKRPVVGPPLRLNSDRVSVLPNGANGEKKSWMPNCEFVRGDGLLLMDTSRWYAPCKSFTILLETTLVSLTIAVWSVCRAVIGQPSRALPGS